MGGRGGWVLDPNTLTLPPQAGPNDPAVIVGPDLPPCMQATYTAALFFRPPDSQTGDEILNRPYYFIAQSSDTEIGAQRVDYGLLLYDPSISQCIHVRHMSVYGINHVGDGLSAEIIYGDITPPLPEDFGTFIGYRDVEMLFNNTSNVEVDLATFNFNADSALIIDSGAQFDVNQEINYGGMASGQSVSATSFTSTSTAYTATGGAVVGRAFVMPPSGQVSIHYGCRISNTGATASTYPSIQIRTGGTIGAGTVVLTADDSQAIDHAGTISDRNGGSYLFSGTAGSTYNVQMVHRVEAGTGTFSERQVYVVPVLC